MTTPPTEEQMVVVELEALPVPLHQRAQEHGDEVTREFRLLAEQLRQEGRDGVPQRLIELIDALDATYGMFSEQQQDDLDAAMAAGSPSIDLRYELPAHVGAAAAALGAMLDEVDEFCRAGEHLLTLATPPDCAAYRRWFLDEFVRQAAGKPPTPWPRSPYASA